MFEQKSEVDKIDLQKIKDEISKSVKTLNLAQGSYLGQTFTVGRFYSMVGFETDEGDKRAIFEIEVNVKMQMPHNDIDEYELAIEELEKSES